MSEEAWRRPGALPGEAGLKHGGVFSWKLYEKQGRVGPERACHPSRLRLLHPERGGSLRQVERSPTPGAGGRTPPRASEDAVKAPVANGLAIPDLQLSAVEEWSFLFQQLYLPFSGRCSKVSGPLLSSQGCGACRVLVPLRLQTFHHLTQVHQ